MTQYILLPRDDIRDTSGEAASTMSSLPEGLNQGFTDRGVIDSLGQQFSVKVIDAISETGPRLVDIDPLLAESLDAEGAPVRAEILMEYDLPEPLAKPVTMGVSSGEALPVTITVRDARSGAPVARAYVIAISDLDSRTGNRGYTDDNGVIQLMLVGDTIAELSCYPPHGYWGSYSSGISLANPVAIGLEPVDLSVDDVVRHYYGTTRFKQSTGVIVGVVDTGVGPHTALNVVGGANTVTGQQPDEIDDVSGHGTHVAGLIGAEGQPPTGIRGIAPRVPIYGYKVFGGIGSKGTNYAILKAMWRAAEDGCDIINLSLGGGRFDRIVEEAIRDARNQGALVVVAAGNDGRKKVRYPAKYSGATAVSAMGREDTYPIGSLSAQNKLRPPESTAYPEEYIASFSNVGPQISVTAPGVGAVSTLPGGSFGPMSGTSMAAPVVSGAAASLLSQNPEIWGLPRNRSRAEMIERLLQTSCVTRGFGLDHEGYGMPDPDKV